MNKTMKNKVIKLTDKERVRLKKILTKIDSSKVFQEKINEAEIVLRNSKIEGLL